MCVFLSSVLELIIEEQVEKLEATLRGIETLSVVARDTASKLTELIGSEEVRTYMYMYIVRVYGIYAPFRTVQVVL